jgi:hypothetical protein
MRAGPVRAAAQVEGSPEIPTESPANVVQPDIDKTCALGIYFWPPARAQGFLVLRIVIFNRILALSGKWEFLSALWRSQSSPCYPWLLWFPWGVPGLEFAPTSS